MKTALFALVLLIAATAGAEPISISAEQKIKQYSVTCQPHIARIFTYASMSIASYQQGKFNEADGLMGYVDRRILDLMNDTENCSDDDARRTMELREDFSILESNIVCKLRAAETEAAFTASIEAAKRDDVDTARRELSVAYWTTKEINENNLCKHADDTMQQSLIELETTFASMLDRFAEILDE